MTGLTICDFKARHQLQHRQTYRFNRLCSRITYDDRQLYRH